MSREILNNFVFKEFSYHSILHGKLEIFDDLNNRVCDHIIWGFKVSFSVSACRARMNLLLFLCVCYCAFDLIK